MNLAWTFVLFLWLNAAGIWWKFAQEDWPVPTERPLPTPNWVSLDGKVSTWDEDDSDVSLDSVRPNL